MIETKIIRSVPYRMCRFFPKGVRFMGQMSGISLSNPPVVMSERALGAMQGYKSIGRTHLVKAHNFFITLWYSFSILSY